MNTTPATAEHAAIDAALATMRRDAARSARRRIALYLVNGVVAVAGFAVAGHVLATQGLGALDDAWPALIAQLGGAAVLVTLLRRHFARLRAFRRAALPVREAIGEAIGDVATQRRESVVLLGFAATATPALLFAVQRLVSSGAIDASGARWLSLACIVPALVIAAVHGPRLQRLRTRRAELDGLARELD